ncbi:MAG: hypothetical protein HYR74_00215 [Candidatus Eisenbacteria bacterium]|nr:hypothetical protein [Candidatus Eisenbacteria bacterium]
MLIADGRGTERAMANPSSRHMSRTGRSNAQRRLIMFTRGAIVAFALLGIFIIAGVGHDVGRRRDPDSGAGAVDTLTATVQVDSIRVISYLDDRGVEHPADSTLVPPVPVQGPRQVAVIVRRTSGAPIAQARRLW